MAAVAFASLLGGSRRVSPISQYERWTIADSESRRSPLDIDSTQSTGFDNTSAELKEISAQLSALEKLPRTPEVEEKIYRLEMQLLPFIVDSALNNNSLKLAGEVLDELSGYSKKAKLFIEFQIQPDGSMNLETGR